MRTFLDGVLIFWLPARPRGLPGDLCPLLRGQLLRPGSAPAKASTATILTAIVFPLGAVYSVESPAARPNTAAPSGDCALKTSSSVSPATSREPAIDVYHYRARYKREADPLIEARHDDGMLRIAESARWPSLGRRSGSILSKMIRRGIHDPRQVQDVLGAMFIVGDRRQTYALEKRLIYSLGGPLRWRDLQTGGSGRPAGVSDEDFVEFVIPLAGPSSDRSATPGGQAGSRQ